MKTMEKNLSQKQRIIVGSLYLLILAVIFKLIGGGFKDLIWNPGIDQSILFYSGAFMIILGAYLVEPFFTKPANAIANATIVLIALLSLSQKNNLLGYSFIFNYSIIVLILSTVTIFIKDSQSSICKKISKITYFFSTNLGQSKVIFSIIVTVHSNSG
jgi:energy-converting hydrogenase Eha subunit E